MTTHSDESSSIVRLNIGVQGIFYHGHITFSNHHYFFHSGLVDRMTEIVNNRRKDEEMDTDLTRADIIKYTCKPIENLRLSGVNLSGLDLSKLNLSRVDLRYACLKNVFFSHANLVYANFQNADLTNANLEGANLEGADLQGAKLTNANLKGANLQRALSK